MPPVIPNLIVVYNMANQMMSFERANLSQLVKYRALNMQGLLNHFNVFGALELNNDGEFEVAHFKPTVLAYRSCDNTCTWTPSGQLETGKTVTTPECIVSQNEYCSNEQLTRLFTNIVKYVNENGNVVTPKLQEMIDAYGAAYADSLLLSTQAILSAGNVYNGVTTTFKSTVSAERQADFNRAKVAATGYVRRLKNLATADATAYGHLNDTSLLPTGSFTGNEFTADVVDLVRAMVDKAKPAFRQAITQGIQVVGEFVQRPVCIMTSSIFNKLRKEYILQGESASLESAPIQREMVTISVPSANGGTVTHNVKAYIVDDIVCVLDASINAYDEFVTSAVHFVALTITGNIHFGTTVGDTKRLTGEDFPLEVQAATSLKEKGKVYMSSKSLVSTLIGDSDFIVSAQRITTPA